MASNSSCTTSCPTTFEQLKPLVHLFNIPVVRLFCIKGKLKVKPRGRTSFKIFSSFINLYRESAMWSNNLSPDPNMMCCGIANIFDFISKWFLLSSMSSTLKFVPPRSRARNLPPSGRQKNWNIQINSVTLFSSIAVVKN